MHKSHQILHKGITGAHNILKFVNHQHLFPCHAMGQFFKYFLKGRKFIYHIAVMGKLSAPQVCLFSLRAGAGKVIVPRTVLHKLLYKRGLTDMFLSVNNQNLTAVSVIIII